MSSAQQSFNVAMLGCGVVGSEVARLLLADDGDFVVLPLPVGPVTKTIP